MKKSHLLFIICLIFIQLGVWSQNTLDQNLPTSGGEVVFTAVKELRDAEIGQHHVFVKRWFDDYDFPFEQVNENDESRDILEGRGTVRVLWGPNNFEQYFKTLKFRIEVVVKKDRYQYRLDHFVVVDGSQEAQLEIFQSDTRLGALYNPAFYRDLDHKMNLLIQDLQTRLNQE